MGNDNTGKGRQGVQVEVDLSKYTLVREEVTVKVTFDQKPEGTGGVTVTCILKAHSVLSLENRL